MRITGGRLKGVRILCEGSGIRPMKEVVRKAVFDILGDRVRGAKVLDLFSGTGALGIEALSREAKRVVFVDASRTALRLVKENLLRAGVSEKAVVVKGRIPEVLKRLEEEGFELVFVTPPYGKGLSAKTLKALREPLLAKDAVVVLEERKNALKKENLEDWIVEKVRSYGETEVFFLTKR